MKYLISILIVFGSFVFAQSSASSYLYGNIIDAETFEPLTNANIFIAHSSIGTASDRNGFFELRNLPSGRYEIIASRIGYELLKIDVVIRKNERRNFRFEMYKEPIQLPAVIVSAKESRKRKKYLEQFRENLIGTSENCYGTYIRNEDVVRFTKKRGLLYAEAVEPLEIMNKSLGYDILYYLEDFELTNDYVKFTGYPQFIEMAAKSIEDSIYWAENRALTYKGSLRHFLKTICQNFELTRSDKAQREHIQDIGNVTDDGILVTYNDTTFIDQQGFYVLNVFEKIDSETVFSRHFKNLVTTRRFEKHLVNTNNFLATSDIPGEMLLLFDGSLEVRYSIDNYPFLKENISWIKLVEDSTIIEINGKYFDKYGINTSGTWGLERVADMLPFDYNLP